MENMDRTEKEITLREALGSFALNYVFEPTSYSGELLSKKACCQNPKSEVIFASSAMHSETHLLQMRVVVRAPRILCTILTQSLHPLQKPRTRSCKGASRNGPFCRACGTVALRGQWLLRKDACEHV